MKKYLLFSLILSVNFAFAQVNDTFNDGNFTTSPVWNGSNSANDFTVVSEQLRSNSSIASSNFYLSTSNTLSNNCYWEFWVNLQFNPSSANYVDVYLTSDQANLQSVNINGYFVRLGNTNDEICLFKRSGSVASAVKIIDGADGILNTSNNKIKIKVTRTAGNVFTLERDITGMGTSYSTEGSITDASFTSSSFFGIFVQQSTLSFHQKHFFDDIKISSIITDISPPELLSATVLDSTALELTFNEPLDSVSAKATTNYTLNNSYGNPASAHTTADASKYILKFQKGFQTASYLISVSGAKDKAGNTISTKNTAVFSYIKPYIARQGDLLINEIFADPSPQIDLPTVEFLEIYNTSPHTIKLANWKYTDAVSTAVLPTDSIKAGQYLILCAKADTNEFKAFGKTLGISPWPSLNNSSDILTLISPENKIIDSVTYADTWYTEALKKHGGWSLEKISYTSLCQGAQNWMASSDSSGGTPGRQNSVYESRASDPLKIIVANLKDSVTIAVLFNKNFERFSAANANNYLLNNGVGEPSSASLIAPLEVELKFKKPIARGNTYRISTIDITDCSGISITPANNFAEFFYPHKIVKGDILISEILFHPRQGGADFVEIYNASDKLLDLKHLLLATEKLPDSLITPKTISNFSSLMKPGQYLVLTTDPDNIKKEYPTQKPNDFVKMAAMPAFNNDAGRVVLVSENVRIDQLNYTDKMHFALIKDPQGISLERSSFKSPSNEPGNFRSAAASAGYATPGYRNSQLLELTDNKLEEVGLTSKTFSPDNDGFEDALQINYHFPEPNMVATASIYNDRGVLIRKLAKNITLSAEGTLTWDGLTEDTQKAPVGIYMVYFDVFSLNGKSKKYRKPCVLAAKF
ncbi:MAG: lamin tail domain-containing protein [Pyrinomonadaceae bacterium]|nr:lamin tail domain-containing protein [Sphingobacteriaceae bacterium]